MPLTTEVQFQIIFYSIVAGFITGAIFDLYRIVRGQNKQKIITAIEDILFGILIALIIFTFLLYKNYAFLGTYAYLFIILAFLIYLRFISSRIIKLELILIKTISKVLRVIVKNFIYPFKLILNNISGKNRWNKKLLE